MIPRQYWKWKGLPGHFICANDCVFRLHTQIGKYKISTVGAMYKDERELIEIGLSRHYETMVFEINGDGLEIDMKGIEVDKKTISLLKRNISRFREAMENIYDVKAEQMHIEMCEKYARLQ